MSEDDKKHDCEGKDMLTAGPEVGGGFRPFERHMPDHTIVRGLMRPLKDGEPILAGGVFALNPRNDGTEVFDVEDVPIPRPPCDDCAASADSHAGPARVSTPAFRNGWDRIFGGKAEVGQA